MRTVDRLGESLDFADRRQWRAWLEQNHTSSSGVWLTVNRKHSSQPGLPLGDAVEEALCFGWIDGKLRPLDGERYTLRMSPRRPKSVWSKSNRQRVERLIVQGTMTPAGMQVVETAQRDGSWSQLDSIDDLVIPGDLAAALAANETAERNFAAFSASSRKMILWWIASARRPETRATRIDETVSLAAENIRPTDYWQ